MEVVGVEVHFIPCHLDPPAARASFAPSLVLLFSFKLPLACLYRGPGTLCRSCSSSSHIASPGRSLVQNPTLSQEKRHVTAPLGDPWPATATLSLHGMLLLPLPAWDPVVKEAQLAWS